MNLDLVVRYLQARKEYLRLSTFEARAVQSHAWILRVSHARHVHDDALAKLDADIELEIKTEDAVGSVP